MISLFRYYIFLETGVDLRLNKFEFPFPKDNLWQVLLKFALWFWRRFLNFINTFSLFRYYLPLWNRRGPSIVQTWTPLPKDDVCLLWFNSTSGSEKEDENVNSLQTDGRTDVQTADDRREEMLTWACNCNGLFSHDTISLLRITERASLRSIVLNHDPNHTYIASSYPLLCPNQTKILVNYRLL